MGKTPVGIEGVGIQTTHYRSRRDDKPGGGPSKCLHGPVKRYGPGGELLEVIEVVDFDTEARNDTAQSRRMRKDRPRHNRRLKKRKTV